MADPRDYIMQAGQQLQAGLSSYADQQRLERERQEALRRQEEMLNRPLPEWTVQQLVGGSPPSAAPLGEAAGMAAGAGAGNMMGQGAGPKLGMGLGQTAQPGPGVTPELSLGQEHPEIEAAAREYASGRVSLEDALARARKYTMRDMPGLEFGARIRGQKTQEGMLRVEEERTRRAYGMQGLKNEGGLALEGTRQEGRKELAEIRDRGMDREGMRRASTAQLKMMNDYRIAELNARKAMEIADKRIAATNDPELNMLKAEVAAALGEYKTATQGINGTAYIIKDALRPELEADYTEARDRFLQASKQLHSYLAAKGTAMAQPGGQPPPMPGGAAAPLGVQDRVVPPPANPIRGGTGTQVREPSVEQLNAPGAGSFPPLSQPSQGPRGAMPGIDPGTVAAGQAAQLPPSPVLGANGKPIVKRLPNGQLVMKMTNGKAAPYNPADWN